MSLRNDKNFIHHLKEAVRKRLRSKDQNREIPPAIVKDSLGHEVSSHFEGSTNENEMEQPEVSVTHSPSANQNG